MSVKYSLLWLLLAVGLVIAAAFPYVVYVLRDLLDIEMPVNLVFLLMFCFVLVVLPVSYTHLDVYKRQVLGWVPLLGSEVVWTFTYFNRRS